MNSQRIGIALSSVTLMAVALAGCTLEGIEGSTGTLILCVQDDPTVNFNGVFVNFGNVQINTATTGDNTINDNDTFNDGGTGAATTDANATANTTTGANATATATATSEATATDNATATATTTDTGAAPTGVTTTGEPAQTIQVTDVECSQLESRGNFDFDVEGQRNIETGDGENPGRADENRGRADSPCDRDQGFGNDWKCENGRASKDVEVESGDVNLLEYQEGRAAFLARAELPPITIDDACITIDDVRVTTNDTQEQRNVTLDVDQVCIQGPIEIREGHQTLAVLKVDLAQSLRDEGDQLVFSPVIHIRAAAPVTQTITVHETTTETVTTGATNETGMATNGTMTTTGTTMSTTTATTFATNETSTASPTPT